MDKIHEYSVYDTVLLDSRVKFSQFIQSVIVHKNTRLGPGTPPSPFPADSPSLGGNVKVYIVDITNRACPLFLFCSCVCFCLYGLFTCISFHKFSRQLSAFSLCSSSLIFALLVLSTIFLFVKVSLSPDIILCG